MNNKKRTLTLAGQSILSVLILSLLLTTVYLAIRTRQERLKIEVNIQTMKDEIALERARIADLNAFINSIDYVERIGADAKVTNVLITNYYIGDSDGSGNATASGLNTKDFTVTPEGIYQYNGFDVLATANTTRWDRPLKEGYKSWNLYEVIVYELNGETRIGMALDVCGACMGLPNEDLQRVDVFTIGSIIGKVQGKIYE